MKVQEYYQPYPLGLNATQILGGEHIAGFLAKTAGAISVYDQAGTLLVDTVPVTAGVYMPIPLYFTNSGGGKVILSGGASGTLFA